VDFNRSVGFQTRSVTASWSNNCYDSTFKAAHKLATSVALWSLIPKVFLSRKDMGTQALSGGNMLAWYVAHAKVDFQPFVKGDL
jgi:hypothetical protein